MGVLGGAPKGQIPHGGLPVCYGGACFDGVRNQPLLNDRFTDHHVVARVTRRRCEGRVRVPSSYLPVESLVVGSVFVKLGRSRVHRCLGINDRWEDTVVHGYQFQGVFRLIAAFGHHYRHGIAHIADGVHRQRRMVDCFDIGVGRQPSTGDGVEHAIGVGAGVHRQHPGRRSSRTGIDAVDLSVGMNAAQNGRVYQAEQLDVIGEGRLPGNQPGIFSAPDA